MNTPINYQNNSNFFIQLYQQLDKVGPQLENIAIAFKTGEGFSVTKTGGCSEETIVHFSAASHELLKCIQEKTNSKAEINPQNIVRLHEIVLLCQKINKLAYCLSAKADSIFQGSTCHLEQSEKQQFSKIVEDFRSLETRVVEHLKSLYLPKENSLLSDAVEHGLGINTVDENGMTSLMLACISDPLPVVKSLIDNGANLEVQDRFGETALMKACRKGNLDVVRELLAQGAKLDTQDKYGGMALMEACSLGNLDIVRELLVKRANLDVQDKRGHTALMQACEIGKIEIVRELLAQGAKLETQDVGGGTALMKACIYGKLEIVRELLAKGAKLETQDVGGGTALMKA
ncbi:MAG: hypothetical protein JWO53_1206, partial [Chlamydiia bacterium]|nr:hypothetical protein [Chlamydiia bacterium]